jgi:hypothetical protein
MESGACLLAAAPRQVMNGPAFDGLAQPALADASEGEPAVMAQDGQISPVFGDLSARVGEGPPEVGEQQQACELRKRTVRHDFCRVFSARFRSRSGGRQVPSPLPIGSDGFMVSRR